MRVWAVFLLWLLAAPAWGEAAAPALPAWLRAHVGLGDGQIAPVVLERARAFYLAKRAEGTVANPCYFAMDATKPNAAGTGPGRRFYVICEAQRSFRAISAGHGGGRDLPGVGDFSNDRVCAKNFGNAEGSFLTAGGDYVTAEASTGFQGYYRDPKGKLTELTRTFIRFDGLGEAANARDRAIGGHAAALLRNVCLMKDPASPHADGDGYVRFGRLITYPAGRSNGCTSWAPEDADKVIAMIRSAPTTLYIYPEAKDIAAVAAGRAGAYWNAGCLAAIKAPRFWSNETLGPRIAAWQAAHPPGPPQPLPLCKGQ